MFNTFGGLEPTAGAPRALVRHLHRPGCFADGTQARVVFVGPKRVIKLTRCPPSIALGRELACRDRPLRGLPRVHRVLGEVAVDTWEHDAPFVGLVVERLRHPRPEEAARVSGFIDAVRELVGPRQLGVSPAFDAEVALRLAAADLCGTGEAFAYLARFLQRHGAVLDVLNDRNVMLDRHGDICLTDPVCFAPDGDRGRIVQLEGDLVLVVRDAQRTAELVDSGLGARLVGRGKNRWRAEGAVRAAESMLLALAAAGIDLESDAAAEAIAAALRRLSDGLQ